MGQRLYRERGERQRERDRETDREKVETFKVELGVLGACKYFRRNLSSN